MENCPICSSPMSRDDDIRANFGGLTACKRDGALTYLTHFYASTNVFGIASKIRIFIKLNALSFIFNDGNDLYLQPSDGASILIKSTNSITTEEISDLYHQYKILS